jgi:hypothetical protein
VEKTVILNNRNSNLGLHSDQSILTTIPWEKLLIIGVEAYAGFGF